MQDRPSALELLSSIAEYLEQDVLPVVDGALRYKTLVAANLVALLERELEAGDGPARRERDELAELLGHPLGASQGPSGGEGDVHADVLRLNGELQQRILADAAPSRAFLLAARDVMERAVVDKLTINKPGYTRYDMAIEVD